ncbi:probable UDP-glucosyl transferase 73B6 [Lotus japonicus]|uniref:probable UDP-glucosyl transferase 73B6 n=1 Tax=Lotus japonicus TaxID=34305 RepID=UPI0025887ADC|nr:probable UDP-glucosyl transferase 73B6 [Lotus japonicus]
MHGSSTRSHIQTLPLLFLLPSNHNSFIFMGALNFQERPLKLYFIPYPASGHMIPLCDIATLFSSRGHHVTIITTPSNAQLIHKSIPSHNLHLHTVPFPSREVGLPDGVENLSAVTELTNSLKVNQAVMMLRQQIQHFVEHHPPDCIVADFLFPWVDEVASKLRVPRLAFNGYSLFAICAMESVKARKDSGNSSIIQGLPHNITLNATPPKTLTRFLEPLLATELKSYGLIVNNFVELDGEEYIEHYERTTGHKAWHLGPVSLIHRTDQEKAERGHKSVVGVDEFLSWLNSKPSNSVLYICFGSLCYFSDKQLYEIASAIDASGYEFIWVVPEKKGKEDESEEEKEKWLPKGFEERNREKGMIVKGWAPQVVILGHYAIGGFLTHCGWNSTVEAVSAGVPMITWPVHDEQFYNEKLITEVRGIGVEVGAWEWSIIGFMERKTLVGRDNIEKAMRRLMDGGVEAENIRQRAQEYGKKARQAVQEGGSSHQNLTALIDDLKRLRDSKPLD